MRAREAGTWKAFEEVVQNFLGNKRSNNYKALVNNSIEKYKKNGVSHVPEVACPAFSS